MLSDSLQYPYADPSCRNRPLSATAFTSHFPSRPTTHDARTRRASTMTALRLQSTWAIYPRDTIPTLASGPVRRRESPIGMGAAPLPAHDRLGVSSSSSSPLARAISAEGKEKQAARQPWRSTSFYASVFHTSCSPLLDVADHRVLVWTNPLCCTHSSPFVAL